MIPRVALREALSDPNLLGTAIAGDSWSSWRTLLIAAMGEELTEDERIIFKRGAPSINPYALDDDGPSDIMSDSSVTHPTPKTLIVLSYFNSVASPHD